MQMGIIAFWSAALSAVVMLLLVAIGGWATPGYSHASQLISELGATGAVNGTAVRFLGFLPAGLSMLVYCLAAWLALPRQASTTAAFIGLGVYAAGYVVAAFLPCDAGCRPAQPSLSQSIHNAVGLAGYLVAPGCLLVLARNARQWPGARLLVYWGFASSAAALVGLMTLAPESPWVGVSQRLIELAVLSWVVASGVYLHLRSTRGHRHDLEGAAAR